jgi:hypothetical protein
MAGITLDDERKRRLDLWADHERLGLVARARPEDLRRRRIYGGAQGIWVDKQHTGQIDGNEDGITVSLLHTGRHYPYPKTKRGVEIPLRSKPRRMRAALSCRFSSYCQVQPMIRVPSA